LKKKYTKFAEKLYKTRAKGFHTNRKQFGGVDQHQRVGDRSEKFHNLNPRITMVKKTVEVSDTLKKYKRPMKKVTIKEQKKIFFRGYFSEATNFMRLRVNK